MTPEQRYRQQAACRKRHSEAASLWGKRKAEIEWLTRDQEWSQARIGEYYGVTQTAIQQVMRRLGIETRSRANYGKRNGRYKDGTESRLYRQMIEKDKCSECGATQRLAVHHKNGDHFDNHLENLQVLCWPCHNSKTKKLYWDNLKASGASFPMSRTASGTFRATDRTPEHAPAIRQADML